MLQRFSVCGHWKTKKGVEVVVAAPCRRCDFLIDANAKSVLGGGSLPTCSLLEPFFGQLTSSRSYHLSNLVKLEQRNLVGGKRAMCSAWRGGMNARGQGELGHWLAHHLLLKLLSCNAVNISISKQHTITIWLLFPDVPRIITQIERS